MPRFFDNSNEKQPSGDYEVGHGKPPVASQWKKGQSGNPSGKKKGRKSWRHELDKIVHEYVNVRLDGDPKRMTVLEGMIRAQIARAFKSDRAFAAVMSLLKETELPVTDAQPRGGVLVVPEQMSMDEWQKVAEEEQRKYRDPAYYDNIEM